MYKYFFYFFLLLILPLPITMTSTSFIFLHSGLIIGYLIIWLVAFLTKDDNNKDLTE